MLQKSKPDWLFIVNEGGRSAVTVFFQKWAAVEASHETAGARRHRLAPGRPWENRGASAWAPVRAPTVPERQRTSVGSTWPFFSHCCVLTSCSHRSCSANSVRHTPSSGHLKMRFLKKPGSGRWLKPFTSHPFICCPVRSVTGSWSERLTQLISVGTFGSSWPAKSVNSWSTP